LAVEFRSKKLGDNQVTFRGTSELRSTDLSANDFDPGFDGIKMHFVPALPKTVQVSKITGIECLFKNPTVWKRAVIVPHFFPRNEQIWSGGSWTEQEYITADDQIGAWGEGNSLSIRVKDNRLQYSTALWTRGHIDITLTSENGRDLTGWVSFTDYDGHSS